MQNHIGKGKLISVNECVPKDIRDKKRKSDEMAINIQNTYRQLQESYDEDQRHNFNLDDINNVLQTLKEEEAKCQKNFDYYHGVLSEFYIKYNLPGTTMYFKSMYCDLSNIIYKEMRLGVEQYLKFLQEAQDPNVYFEKQKQQPKEKPFVKEKPSGFVAAKLNSKPEKHILGDGSSLPPVGTQEYDEGPRHRSVKSTRSYR